MDTHFIYALLYDLQYPTEKAEVLLHAQLKGVGEDMYNLLLALPDKRYGSCRNIVAELPLSSFESRINQYL